MKRERKKHKRLRKKLCPFFMLKDEIGKTLPDWKVMPTVYLVLACLYIEGTLVSWVHLPGHMYLEVRVVFLDIR